MQQDFAFSTKINYRQLFRVLWNFKYFIAVVFFVTLFDAYLKTISTPPSYRATSTVVIAFPEKKYLDFGNEGNDYNSNRLTNEIQIIQSRSLAEEVIKTLSVNAKNNTLELFGKRRYRTTLEKLLHSEVIGNPLDTLRLTDTQVQEYAESLRGRISVKKIPDTDFLEISVSSPFADEAAYLANTVCNVYKKRDIQKSANQAISAQQYIKQELDQQRSELAKSEENVIAYARANKIYGVDSTASGVLSKLIDAESQYLNTKTEYNIAKSRQDYLLNKLSSSDQAVSSRISDNMKSRSSQLQAQLRNDERDLVSLTSQLGADDPQVIEKKKEIVQLKQQMADLSRRDIAAGMSIANRTKQYQFGYIGQQLQNDAKLADLEYTAAQYQQLKNTYEKQLSQLPEKQLGYARLLRDQAVLNRNYTFLKQKYQEAGMAVASQVGKVTIIDPASIPGGSESPNMLNNLIRGALTGLLSGIVLSFVINLLDTAIHESDYITDKGFVILSRIPWIGKDKINFVPDIIKNIFSSVLNNHNLIKSKQSNDALWISDRLSSTFAESFRDLRTAITFSQSDKVIRSLLITSSEPGDGKTTTCSNLAYAYALIGKKVLVVDCDLRRPSQHIMFSIKRSPGLSDYLAGQVQSLNSIINKSSKIENLFVLPSGQITLHPQELLESKKMADLVLELENSFDIVLLDSPPFEFISDALLLSQSVDGVIIVAKTGKTSKSALKKLESLDYIKPAILGFALIEKSTSLHYGLYGKYGKNGLYYDNLSDIG
ncbi:MAG: polysaccharide biosynthesis tyrosine autokinase [Chlorobium sp.]|nr:MAG: polysaccharide biosynthesis tyrosine autokinase [Chlorobium sp.]